MRFTVGRGQKEYPALGIRSVESYLLNSISPRSHTSRTMASFKWRGQKSKLLFDYSLNKGYMQAVELQFIIPSNVLKGDFIIYLTHLKLQEKTPYYTYQNYISTSLWYCK